METKIRLEHTILLLMFLLHAFWLGMKVSVGEVDERMNALTLLYWLIGLGVVLIVVPMASSKFKVNFTPQVDPFQAFVVSNQRRILAGSVLFYFILNSLFNHSISWQADEDSVLRAAGLIVNNGWTYFFQNYDEVEWLGSQHPPLHIMIVGFFAKLLQTDILSTARIIAGVFGLGTLWITFRIATFLFDRQVAWLAVVMLIGIRKFYLFSVLSGNDMLSTFFFALTVFSLLKINRNIATEGWKQLLSWSLLCGLAIGLGCVSKYTSLISFGLVPLLLFWPLESQKHNTYWGFLRHWKKSIPVILLILLVAGLILGAWIWYLIESQLYLQQFSKISMYLGMEVEVDAEEESVEITSTDYASDWRITFLLSAVFRKIPTSIGLYLLPLLFLAIRQMIAVERSKDTSLKWKIRLLIAWILLVFIPILIFLPVDRYFMPYFPAIAIFSAWGIQSTFKAYKCWRILWITALFSISSIYIYFNSI